MRRSTRTAAGLAVALLSVTACGSGRESATPTAGGEASAAAGNFPGDSTIGVALPS